MKFAIALLSGTIFGFGLAISGMTDTRVVLGFLDLFGRWDARLLFVMASALLVTMPAFYFILRKPAPLSADKFYVSENQKIDKQLLLGAMVFGIGWGLYGWCPGPALSSLVYRDPNALLFVAAMLAGMFVANKMKTLLS